ncbi:RagB/SusD family nutrient uptake outer membrane protein [Mariniphaga sediminis]|uniref:RagB/SusD family nutrient uptake outer membrane protein n=2 Tax=Mariniphaga sediminis TaxID=1628158 RepID=A0A399DB40_9BACT|nr:RagB/SusD family nutrient uptake outer membrane protein [Mariniphaga sediminis]
MKMHIRKASFFLILLMILSCQESFLEINPFGSVSEATLSNEMGVNKLLIGAYSLLDGAGATGGGIWVGHSYLRGGDDANAGTEFGPSGYSAFLYTEFDQRIEDNWKFGYAAVGRANDVLRILPKVEDSTPEKLLQIEAEAKFLRGVFYLEQLVKFYRNVPWIDETINYSDGNYLVPNTIDIFPEIEADFTFAAENLTETKSEVGRANNWAAKAYLAKTYMFQHKYAAAKDLLDDIIANGQTSNGLKYALLEQYNHNFITRTKHGAEAVFAVQMSVNDGTTSGNGNPRDQYNGTYGGPATCCYGWLQATFDLVDAYQTDAETGLPLLDTYQDSPIPHDNGLSSAQPFTPYAGTLDPRLDWVVGRRGIPYRDWGVHPGMAWVRNQINAGPYNCLKNIVEKARVDTDRGTGGASNNPYNLIRFADVLLWAAECEVEVGSLQKAEDYVNLVRDRAANPEGFVKKYINPDDPLAGFTDEPAANYKVGLYDGQFVANGKTYARKAVYFERRLELAMEHHRFFDMVRYDGLDFDIKTTFEKLFVREGNEITNPSNNWLAGVFVRNKHEYFPIPQGQIDLSVDKDGNSVLAQNPGYN